MALRLLIANNDGDELYEIDPDGSDSQGGLLRALPSGLTGPQGMAVFNGRLLIADANGSELFDIDPDGADSQVIRLRALPPGLTAPLSMAVYNGRLLITDDDGDELHEIDPDGSDSQGGLLRALPFGIDGPRGMAVFNGRLLIADLQVDELFDIDPDGADSQVMRLRALPSGLTDPQAMAVYNGRLLIANDRQFENELYEIDPDGSDSQGGLLRALPSGLTGPQGMATFGDPDVAPSFTDDTGDAISGTAGTAIANVTVPAADGTPAPTYAASGLPGGLSFDTTTRVLSGTPTAAGSGTITVTATNSEGSADWTVAYAFVAAAVAPSWTDDTGDAISGTAGTAIANVTVPAVDAGTPAPTYAVVGSLPSGLSFNTGTRVLSGTPAAASSGTIRIRATNTAGTDDWTVDYAFTLPDASAPSIAIRAVAAGDEGTTVTLSAIVGSVGSYDAIDYAWVVSGGTLNNASAVSPVWTRPDVSADTAFSINLTITARGTGTNAANGTSDTATSPQRSATVRNVLAALVLSDFDTPDGIDMRVLALIETGTLAGNEVYDANDNRGSLLDGDNTIENVNGSGAFITVGRFQVDSGGGRITLNRRGGSGNFRDGFGGEAGEVYAEATVYLQFVNGTVITLTNTEQNSPGGGFLSYSTPAFPAAWQIAAHTLRTSGTRFILGIGIPEPVGVDHTADAGGASWAFAAPEPSITYTPALTLADRVIPSGHNTVFAALIHAQVSSLNVFGATLDGDTRLTSDLTIASGAPLVFSVQFFRGGSGNFANLFGAGRALREASFHIQTTATDLNSVDIDNIPSSDVEADAFYVSRTITGGTGFRNRFAGLVTGNLFILSMTLPPLAHAVNAGDASWTFDAAQPGSSTSRVADASTSAWDFDIREPSVDKALGA